MTQIFLKVDGSWCEVTLPSDLSFTYTVENPYFESGGAFTLEITVPTTEPVNYKLFGFVSRVDISKTRLYYPARLMVDNRCLLDGTAHVTSVSDISVGLQLLGGNADLAAKDAEKLYIDEIVHEDLTPPRDRSYAHTYLGCVYSETSGNGDYYYFNPSVPYPGKEYVAVPVWDETSSEQRNRGIIWRESNVRFRQLVLGFQSVARGQAYTAEWKFALQPRLGHVVDMVMAAYGYPCDTEDLRLGFRAELYRRLILIHANHIDSLDQCLPHITVKDFIEAVCLFFNCVIEYDYVEKRTTFRRRVWYMTLANTSDRAAEYIDKVVDAYNVDIDGYDDVEDLPDDKLHGVPRGENVGYDLSYPDYKRYYLGSSFKKYVRDDDNGQKRNFVIIPVIDGATGLICSLHAPDDRKTSGGRSSTASAVTHPKSVYAYQECGELDARDPTRDCDKLNKINPCAMTDGDQIVDCGLIPYTYGSQAYNKWDLFFTLSVPMIAHITLDEDTGETMEEVVESNLTPDDEVKDASLNVALYVGWSESCNRMGVNGYIDYSFSDILPKFVRLRSGTLSHQSQYSLSIRPRTSLYDGGKNTGAAFSNVISMYDAYYAPTSPGTLGKIDESVQTCFTFIDEKIFDVRKPFIVAGKQYICHKIEYTITIDGFDKVKKGYFHELLTS